MPGSLLAPGTLAHRRRDAKPHRRQRAGLLATLALLLAGCASNELAARGPGDHPPRRTVLLVSIDGFRADYLDRGLTPTLSALAGGARAVAMRPAFPSITFPNHTTLVTGLDPDHHGVISNRMEDPADPSHRFEIDDARAVHEPFWWQEATPIWVTAARQGVRSAIEFWPGSTTPNHGILPAASSEYDGHAAYATRVDTVLHWLDAPDDGTRPGLLALYFEGVDSAGHRDGPDSSGVNDAIRRVDAALGRLVEGLRARGLLDRIDIVVVSDHGMEAVPRGQVIRLDQMLGSSSADILTDGPIADIRPREGREAKVARILLAPHAHMQCWRRQDIPKRLDFGSNPRVLPFFCLAGSGWVIAERPSQLEDSDGGAHGYDIADPEMAALFLAHGPDFRPASVLPEFPNVDVYALLAALLGIRPEPSQGETRVFDPALTDAALTSH